MIPLLLLSTVADQHMGVVPLINKHDLMCGELKAVTTVLELKMKRDKLPTIPAFDSTAPPSWSTDPKKLREVLGLEESLTLNVDFVSCMYRPWKVVTTD